MPLSNLFEAVDVGGILKFSFTNMAFYLSISSFIGIRLHEKSLGGFEVSNTWTNLVDPYANTPKPVANKVGGKQYTTENGSVEQGSPTRDEESHAGREHGLDQIQGFPTLLLSPEQFTMIRNIDAMGFKKHRVHIHRVRHTHAAIVVRSKPMRKHAFDEGKLIIKHWLEEEFVIT